MAGDTDRRGYPDRAERPIMPKIALPLALVIRTVDLLGDIATMRPGFEIYDAAKVLTRDLLAEVETQTEIKKRTG